MILIAEVGQRLTASSTAARSDSGGSVLITTTVPSLTLWSNTFGAASRHWPAAAHTSPLASTFNALPLPGPVRNGRVENQPTSGYVTCLTLDEKYD
jgi:hypothetical protein